MLLTKSDNIDFINSLYSAQTFCLGIDLSCVIYHDDHLSLNMITCYYSICRFHQVAAFASWKNRADGKGRKWEGDAIEAPGDDNRRR